MKKNKAAQELNKLRNKSLTKEQRREIAIKANKASQLVRGKNLTKIDAVV